MTTQTIPKPEWATYGPTGTSQERFPYLHYRVQPASQLGQAVRTGVEGQRQDQIGSLPVKVSDYSTGGMIATSVPQYWTQALNRLAYNPGIQTHIPGIACEPYALTTQASMTSDVDITGYRAANLRLGEFETNLGGTKNRYGAVLGKMILRDTSTSNPALTVAASLTNNGLCAREIVANSTRYLAIGTDGDTDDLCATADFATASPSFATKIMTYPAATDAVFWIEHLPELHANVFGGVYNSVAGIYYFFDDEAIPVTPRIVVEASTRYIANPSNAVTSQTKTANLVTRDTSIGTRTWNNATATRLATSDNSYVATPSTASAAVTYGLVAHGYNFSLPTGSLYQGHQDTWELAEGNAAMNAFIDGTNSSGIRTMLSGSPVGELKTDAAELTTDTQITFGAQGDGWGYPAGFTAANIDDISFGSRVVVDIQGANGNPVNVDYHSRQVWYIPPGQHMSVVKGEWSSGKLAHSPLQIPVVYPISAEQATINQPRRAKLHTFAYDADGDRIYGTTEFLDFEMSHIEDMTHGIGGVIAAGDSVSGAAKSLKLQPADGINRNLRLIGVHGTTGVGVTCVTPHGSNLILEMSNESGTDTQWWYWMENATYHASTLIESTSLSTATAGGSTAMDSLPVGKTTRLIASEQRRIYRVFPEATDTAVGRCFIPRNLLDDPFLANTGEVRHDGTLSMYTPELIFGSEESNSSILWIAYAGRHVSVSGSGAGATNGTVRMKVEIDNSVDFSTVAIDTGALSTSLLTAETGRYNVPTSGVALKAMRMQLTMVPGTNAAPKTPNLLPWIMEMAIEIPDVDVFTFWLDPESIKKGDKSRSPYELISNLKDLGTLANGGPAQTLSASGVPPLPAIFDDYELDLAATPIGVPAQPWSEKALPWVRFRAVRGTT